MLIKTVRVWIDEPNGVYIEYYFRESQEPDADIDDTLDLRGRGTCTVTEIVDAQEGIVIATMN
jgi:hypothetical protein